ncbi:hypothetical protein KCP77_16540 [Salmonella enterica subsp. enterica]|nr:hypothetical protein KCP77_16540 [Salmonella enterica subsp. enterica]
MAGYGASCIERHCAGQPHRIINKRYASFIAGQTAAQIVAGAGTGRRIFGARGRKIYGGKYRHK